MRRATTTLAFVAAIVAAAPVQAQGAPPPSAADTGAALTPEPDDYAHGRGLRPLVTGSHIRRRPLMDGEFTIVDSPLYIDLRAREFLELRRMQDGVAAPDTTAALGIGGPGTSRLELRLQPTLILLNGRRLVSAPFPDGTGADYVDINQIPIPLVERAELSMGTSAGIYGDGAIGGVVNFITRRDLDGVEVDMGAATAMLDHFEGDVSLSAGVTRKRARVVGMISYFKRASLAATDRAFISERSDRVDSLLGNPGTYWPGGALNIAQDPLCNDALARAYGAGSEGRLPEHGRREVPTLDPADQAQLLPLLDGMGNNDGVVQPEELFTYCTGNFTRNQDLILEEERIQAFGTAEYDFSRHVHAFAEAGLYRNTNSNRTAPSFPIIAPNPGLFVPADHADLPQGDPFRFFGGGGNIQRYIGRVEGNWAEAQTNERQIDYWRFVGGLRGDFRDVGEGSAVEGWDWELSGLYTISKATSTVQDVVTDRLITALNSCSAPTIEERQRAGCYNPFFSSVTNNAALNPEFGDPSLRGPYPVESGGFICDPNDPSRPCPPGFDPALAGTVNTDAVIDGMMTESVAVTKKTLLTVDGILRGPIVELPGGDLEFAVGWQNRIESLAIGYDSIYNADGYAFLFGGRDLDKVSRHIFAGFGELRWPLVTGLELQTGARYELYEDIGGTPHLLAGLGYRPLAIMDEPPPALEFFQLRGSFGLTQRAPSLFQLHGQQTTMEEVDYRGLSVFRPFRASGNDELDPERITSMSGGLSWDYVGIHVAGDYYRSRHEDVIGVDNPRTLVTRCEPLVMTVDQCPQLILTPVTNGLEHMEVAFDNLAEVETDGVDAVASYTLDTGKRGLGNVGAFTVGLRAIYVRSYLIRSIRAIREFWPNGEEEAAGKRNFDNFAPPIPQLRASLPIRWRLAGHSVGVTARYIDSYRDDSENTFEERGNETIPSWTVYDLEYGYSTDLDLLVLSFTLGALNVLDTDPPPVESPLGYEVGVHDPRGRILFTRLRGEF